MGWWTSGVAQATTSITALTASPTGSSAEREAAWWAGVSPAEGWGEWDGSGELLWASGSSGVVEWGRLSVWGDSWLVRLSVASHLPPGKKPSASSSLEGGRRWDEDVPAPSSPPC